jgi:pyridoxal phosphate enzyme (YggS family)
MYDHMHVRLSGIQSQIQHYLITSDRTASPVRLIAVSKTQPAAMIREAFGLGLRDFGENYADELVEKAEALQDLGAIRWIFIGQLQSNKIQKIVRHAHEIQSVASEKHARYIERYVAENSGDRYPVWIAVNAGDEGTKQGVSFDQLPDLANFMMSHCPHLELQGIMAIPPSSYSDEAWKRSGGDIPELYRRLKSSATQTGKGKLSLGMTADLGLAIHAGSDCVRIGTALFGPRQTPTTHKAT